MEPVLDGRFPRLTFVWNVLDKAARIQPQPFGEGDIFIIQSAAIFLLPARADRCLPFYHHRFSYYTERTSTNQDYKEDDYGT